MLGLKHIMLNEGLYIPVSIDILLSSVANESCLNYLQSRGDQEQQYWQILPRKRRQPVNCSHVSVRLHMNKTSTIIKVIVNMIFLADRNRVIQLSGKRSIPSNPRTHTNSACCFSGYGDRNMSAFVFKTAS